LVTEEELRAFSELRGNTLRVYLTIIRNDNPMGIRELQRKLEFSSPALATYHLEKLENLQLIEKTSKGYVLIKEVKIGALAQTVKFGSLLLPRYTFYVALFATLLVLYLVSAWFSGSFEWNINSISAILLGLLAVLVMVYECIRIWKSNII
jgi:predicted DNA-binding transcriptional regulator